MTNKISNSNKNHIHIHIGDKGKKKRRHRRKTASRGHGHGGTHVVTNHISVPVHPLFNRSQTLDTSMGDDRERERIRIQRGVFESQTPSNTSNAFGNGAPVNDYESFVGNVKRYIHEEEKRTKQSQKPPASAQPKSEPPAQPKTEQPPAPIFKFVVSASPPPPVRPASPKPHPPPPVRPASPKPHSMPVAPVGPFTSQMPPPTSAATLVHSDPVPSNHAKKKDNQRAQQALDEVQARVKQQQLEGARRAYLEEQNRARGHWVAQRYNTGVEAMDVEEQEPPRHASSEAMDVEEQEPPRHASSRPGPFSSQNPSSGSASGVVHSDPVPSNQPQPLPLIPYMEFDPERPFLPVGRRRQRDLDGPFSSNPHPTGKLYKRHDDEDIPEAREFKKSWRRR